jgi:hypothetical protein
MKFRMNHDHIYSDSASCEQLKAVDIIFKEEGYVCPTSPRTPSPTKNINNNKQTKTIQILYILAVPAITLLEIFGSPAHYLSNVFQCQSTQCLHLPQCSELTCWCLIIQCYAKLFIKENLLLAMYYKENCVWNSIIVTTVSWIAINDLILGFFQILTFSSRHNL